MPKLLANYKKVENLFKNNQIEEFWKKISSKLKEVI